MGIRVECPNGHTFKVKDKYAGKKGLCPHCKGQVEVLVPDAVAAEIADMLQMDAMEQPRPSHSSLSPTAEDSDSNNEPHDLSGGGIAGSSASLLGSSVIRHNIRCKCGESVPMWYARCPACGDYLDH